MKIPKISESFDRLKNAIPQSNSEKAIFRISVAALAVTVFLVLFAVNVHYKKTDIEKKIGALSAAKLVPSVTHQEMKRYEAVIDKLKYPESADDYKRMVSRDPFSKYYGDISAPEEKVVGRDFILRSIEKMPLPLVYKGYIELPDKVVAQVNWKNSTRFIEAGGNVDGYKISGIFKDKIEIVTGDGKKMDFFMNKPVLSDLLNAVLYDSVTRKTFNVQMGSEIDDYKVIDISSDYVILLSNGSELKLTR